MQSSDFQSVSAFLNSLNIHYPVQWVVDCINNCKTLKSNISPNELASSVYQKWLLVDLRELKTSCLPNNIKSYTKISLPGKYVVQVESMVNSAKSSYSELQMLKGLNTDSDNTDGPSEVSNSKRCLTFHLCDGVQEVQAMEYHPLPSIRLNDPQLLPGFKMLIKGPVICRKGMLLLKEENIKVYGGKVDKLCEKNKLESLLCRKLGLNEDDISNKNPVQQESSPLQKNQESDVNCHEKESQINVNEIDHFMSDNDDLLLNLSYETADFNIKKDSQEYSKTRTPVQQKISTYMKTLKENNKNRNLNSTSDSGTCSVYNELTNMNIKRAKLDKSAFSIQDSTDNVIEDEFNKTSAFTNNIEDDILIMDDFDIPLHILEETNMEENKEMGGKSMEIDNPSLADKRGKIQEIGRELYKTLCPRVICSFPFVYLKQILDLKLFRPKTFVVKAIILTLKSKISIKNDEFSLNVCITDGSLAIDVNFCSAVLENILEYSPCEVTSMMSEKSKNSAVTERVKKIFFAAQQKLISMNCLMEIKFFTDGTVPTVLKLEEVQANHVSALKARQT